MLILPIDY